MRLLPRLKFFWRWGNGYVGVRANFIKARYHGENSHFTLEASALFLGARLSWAWKRFNL